MNPKPIAVEPLEDFRLLLTFTGGVRRVLDMKPWLDRSTFQRLNNKGFFSLVKIDGGCIYWNDDIDMCPDVLYLGSVDE